MSDFSQLLSEKVDTIAQQWVDAVAHDRQITSTDRLSQTAIRNHIPHVLAALITVLAEDQANDVETLAQASLQHGTLRAEQGFDPTEIAREYHLLRSIILAALRNDLLLGTTEAVLRAVMLIDAVVDAAIAQCFRSYVSERLQELEQLQHQLTLTNQELNRLVTTSQDNLALLAHELKTPLNSIIGYSELFLRQQRQSEIRDSVPSLEHIERVLRNGRQLLHMINDALEFSRYEVGRITLQPVPTDVRSLIAQVVEVIQPLAEARELQIVLDCEQAPDQVITDPLRLQQVLTNLCSNSIRYTQQGSVTIACRVLNDHQWSVIVADTGIGIAPEHQSRIFEPYFRVLAAGAIYPSDSTGLGLAIVDRLVKLLQGSISLVSQTGVGSTFTVILPREVTVLAETQLVGASGLPDAAQ